jgi:hypothetical protein
VIYYTGQSPLGPTELDRTDNTSIFRHPLTATAICSEASRCLTFEREDLQRLFQENNSIGYVVMEHLTAVIASRLRDVRLQLIRELGLSLMHGW